jgi:hypothetical protein
MNTPSTSEHKKGIPWLAVGIGLLAIASCIPALQSANVSFYDAQRIFHVLVLLMLLLGGVGFIWGLVRYFTTADEARRRSGVHLFLWSLALFIAAIAIWFLVIMLQTTFSVSNVSSMTPAIIPSASSDRYERAGIPSGMQLQTAQYSILPNQPYYSDQPSITDTREFNKLNYRATMRSRNVPSLTRLVEVAVRGNGGRVDRLESSEKSGHISFVVPQSKFEDFRIDMESMVDTRFLSVTISSQNMLAQKLTIEQKQDSADKSLATAKVVREKVVSDHKSALRTLQAQLDSVQQELVSLGAQKAAIDIDPNNNPIQLTQIESLIRDMEAQSSTLSVRIGTENSVYANKLQSADQQILYAQSQVDGVEKQDQSFTDNVETVNGTISIRWIGLVEMAFVYVPGFWIPGILATLTYIAIWWHRRKNSVVLV